MIAAWMVYTTVVSLLIGAAAMGAERVARLLRQPGRWAWASAGIVSIGSPVLAFWLAGRPGVVAPSSSTVAADALLLLEQLTATADAAPFLSLSDALLAFWVVGTLGLGGVIVAGQMAVRRQLRAWPDGVVAGTPVKLARRFGPAVVGGWRSVIVLPDWVARLEAEAQRLVVAHEREHLRAGDAALLTAGLALVVLMPWNAPLWWQWRRLRDAVELDCDNRLLRAGIDVRAYSELLLEIARHGVALRAPVPTLSNPKSLLARRIHMMTETTPRVLWPRAAMAAALSTVFVALACETPMPAAVQVDEFGNVTSLTDVVSEDQVDVRPARLSGPVPKYPEMLRRAGIEGTVLLDFVIDVEGRVDTASIAVVSSTNPAFEAPAREVIARSIYSQAKVGDEPVAVGVQQRIAFTIARGAGDRVARFGEGGPAATSERYRRVLEAFADSVSPLVVIDGEVVRDNPGAAIAQLDTETIERIEVIQGTAAVRLFGERGAAGVIQITLKGVGAKTSSR